MYTVLQFLGITYTDTPNKENKYNMSKINLSIRHLQRDFYCMIPAFETTSDLFYFTGN